MFATQLQGVFQKIETKESIHLEEGARLLSQALVGDGKIFIKGFGELQSVELIATLGPEPLKRARTFNKNTNMEEICSMDRVLLVARHSNDVEAIEFAKKLIEREVPIVAITTIVNQDTESLNELVDVHIDTHLTRGLLPDEVGGRFGLPTSLIALYTYYGLSFTIQEIVDEYE